MHVILMEKMINLGNLGDEVKVKAGYARNFLIPKGKAKRATPENRQVFEALRAELEKAQADKLAIAQSSAARMDGLNLTLGRKAGVDGRLFGSVTSMDILEALAAQGIDIERGSVRMPDGPLKSVGEYTLHVALHADVTAAITVTVTASD
jgi:large subunit ribosomal protein L9